MTKSQQYSPWFSGEGFSSYLRCYLTFYPSPATAIVQSNLATPVCLSPLYRSQTPSHRHPHSPLLAGKSRPHPEPVSKATLGRNRHQMPVRALWATEPTVIKSPARLLTHPQSSRCGLLFPHKGQSTGFFSPASTRRLLLNIIANIKPSRLKKWKILNRPSRNRFSLRNLVSQTPRQLNYTRCISSSLTG